MSSIPRVPLDLRLPSRYQVSRVIGRGGAAVVLQAHDARLQREVAIKVFSQPASTPELLIAQEREAQLLARAAHPNLVTIHDVGAERGSSGTAQNLFLVMEYVNGPDLAQWLRLHRASALQVAELGVALCSALQFVHHNGVLHCDIKPSNVLLQIGADGELVPKLADFGIATVLGGGVNQGEYTVGTAAYLSPEQVEGDPLQAPSDVYALGLVLLEAASGRVAFPGAVVASAMARLDHDPYIDPDIPDDLSQVLEAMTARDPKDRILIEDARSAFRALVRSSVAGTLEAEKHPPEASDDAEIVTGTVFRTLGTDARMPALDRAVALAARTVGATGAVLVTHEHGETILQASTGLDAAAAQDLATRRTEIGMRGSSVPITGSRGETLGTLTVTHLALADDERTELLDIAYLVGQVIELRAATRRALLSQ